jgi:hypothetical protein
MTSQYGAYALHAGEARLHARTGMHTPTLPGTHMYAGMHTETKCNTYSFPTKVPQYYVIRTLPILFNKNAVCYRHSVSACVGFQHLASLCLEGQTVFRHTHCKVVHFS